MAKYTKCNFCAYFVGGECTVASASGRVDTYRCKPAEYEYNQWLRQQKQKLKPKSWH
jgi:hypothetical protein